MDDTDSKEEIRRQLLELKIEAIASGATKVVEWLDNDFDSVVEIAFKAKNEKANKKRRNPFTYMMV